MVNKSGSWKSRVKRLVGTLIVYHELVSNFGFYDVVSNEEQDEPDFSETFSDTSSNFFKFDWYEPRSGGQLVRSTNPRGDVGVEYVRSTPLRVVRGD